MKNDLEEITLNDYVLTNVSLETGYFTIRLKDNKEYIVYLKKEAGKKQVNFIEKDGRKIPLSDEVVKVHLEEVKAYQHGGI